MKDLGSTGVPGEKKCSKFYREDTDDFSCLRYFIFKPKRYEEPYKTDRLCTFSFLRIGQLIVE
jgi:hypothetical protein